MEGAGGDNMNKGAAGSGFHGFRRSIISASSSAGMKQSTNVNMNNNHSKENNHSSGNNNNVDDGECVIREQDRFMPIANVIRIMRKILPPHAKISDDAKETIQECVSEFISFITGEANDRCQREQRKTITAEDVLWAMSKLGFDDYIEPLTLYLNRYRDLEGDRGGIRGESLMKRVPVVHDPSGGFNMGPASAYGPPMVGFPYQLPHQGVGAGFYPQMASGGCGGGGYMKDGPNMGSSSSQPASGIEHHPHYGHPNNH